MRAYGQPVRYDWSWFLHDKQSGRFYQIIFDFEKYKFQKDKLRYRSIKVTDLNYNTFVLIDNKYLQNKASKLIRDQTLCS